MKSLNIKGKIHNASVRHLVVTAENSGRRLDRVLREIMRGVPNSRICRMLRCGEIRVNGCRARPGYSLCDGDKLRLPPMEYRPEVARPQPQIPGDILNSLRQSVLYEDSELLAINKPSGLAVHGGSRLRFDLLRAMKKLRPGCKYLELGHRLDRDTSGCLLLCKNQATQRGIHAMFRKGEIKKLYLAMVLGVPRKNSMEVSLPLQYRGRNTRYHDKVVVSEHGKEAITIVKLRETGENHSLLELEPVTGRTHQLRVHLAQTGHPIAGDTRYGDRDFNRELSAMGLNRLFLHSVALRLPEYTGVAEIRAKLPPELQSFYRVIYGKEIS